MKESGINLQVHYNPVHLQPFYRKNYGFNTGDYPVSESFYRNEVSLPIYSNLSDNDQKKVINKIILITK
jgi:dTDP-4-amino-4,6-dideoxygalactose transaminase